MANLIGHARVRTDDQTVALQTDALTAVGCARVFTETTSGGSIKQCDQLVAALDYLNPGDTLVDWRLDRLGGSVLDPVQLAEDSAARDIQLRSLTGSMDTCVPNSERTKAGLLAADEARGCRRGRPPALTPEHIDHACELRDHWVSIAFTACTFGCSRGTIKRAIDHADFGPDPAPELVKASVARNHQRRNA